MAKTILAICTVKTSSSGVCPIFGYCRVCHIQYLLFNWQSFVAAEHLLLRRVLLALGLLLSTSSVHKMP